MTQRHPAGGRLLLLGAPRVLDAGGGVANLPETAPAFLIVHLAVLRQWVPREAVAALLWPDLPDERGQHNLRVALNRAGALLARVGLSGALHAERRRVRLDAPTDVADFRDAVAAADWARACSLADAPLLEGMRCQPYPALAEWMAVEREAYRRQWRRSLIEASQAGAAGGASAASALPDGALERYLAAHPADAEMATLQVSRLAASQRIGQARDVVEGFRRAAAEELPPGDVDAAARQIERAAAGAWSGRPAGPDDTSIIGRGDALAALADAVAANRLVTVTGLPGVGKSTLLRAFMAADPAGSEARRAFVEVGESSTAAGVIERIVGNLTGKPAPRLSTEAGLQRLEVARGVLVFDGIEQAPAAAGLTELLGALLARAPGVHVLVSARRPLSLEGEHVVTLGGLPTRGLDGAPGAVDSPAGLLFMREARRARPGFEFDAHPNEVGRIVQASGGLPLALKLAAGWARWLAPGAITAELERGLQRERGVLDPSLHRLMRATWQRLEEPEREALEALSLLPGSFDMAAAAAVADASAAMIDTLAAGGLVEVHDAATQPQLSLHQLVKAYAAGQLRLAPQRRRQAAARFVHWLRECYGDIPRIEGQPALRSETVAPLIEPTVQAWTLALEIGALDAVSWLLSALQSWHEDRGESRAGLARLDLAQEALDESIPAEAALLGTVQLARATLCYQLGDHDRSAELSLAAVRLARATAQARLLRRALNMLGLNRWQQMRLDEAESAIEEAMAEAVAHDDRKGERAYVGNLGLLDKARGRYASAEERYRRALALARELDRIAEGMYDLTNLANLLRHLRRFDEAEALALEALRLCHEHQLIGKRPRVLLLLAMIHRGNERWGAAAECLDLLDACGPAVIEGDVEAEAAALRADMALDLGRRDEARAAVVAALRLSQRTDLANVRTCALATHGRYLWEEGRHDEAHALWIGLLRSLLDAPQRDQLLTLLADRGLALDAAVAPVDLALVVEKLLG